MVAMDDLQRLVPTFEVLTSKEREQELFASCRSLFVSMKRGERGRLILFWFRNEP